MHEWRKDEKQLYLPGRVPELLDVPVLRYFAIQGQGNPNGPLFAEHVGALYTLTYGVRMLPRKGITPEGFYEYKIYPLEGVWTLAGPWDMTTPLDKDALLYTLMIRQPDFVTPELFVDVLDMAKKKKDASPHLVKVSMVDAADGLSVQMLHIGPYDDEPASFALMNTFSQENGLTRIGHDHREIYLGDPRKGKPENRKTVLRYQVTKD